VKSALSPDLLAKQVIAGDPAAVARAISLVEDRRASGTAKTVELLAALGAASRREDCQRIGITGPPGAGKSSLVSALARLVRASGRSIGVLAVDPSSPRSGGALLADRARIEIDPDDSKMFVRSMASGGDLGGLARAAGAAVDVLSAAFDVVLVETTGVGQSETDVEHVADSVLLVIQPASGDMLQFLKAGILEIPDVFVVNKADLGDVATRASAELRAAMSTTAHGGTVQDAWIAPVVMTSVATGRGLGELLEAADAHFRHLRERSLLAEHRRESAAAWALQLYTRRYGEVSVERAGGPAKLLSQFRESIAKGATAVEAVARAAGDT
jgi:LAO/AO transport system kinase